MVKAETNFAHLLFISEQCLVVIIEYLDYISMCDAKIVNSWYNYYIDGTYHIDRYCNSYIVSGIVEMVVFRL